MYVEFNVFGGTLSPLPLALTQEFRPPPPSQTHTKKSFLNLIKSNRNQIVLSIFRFIWNQTDVRSVPNQSENGIYNLISG